MSTSISKYSTIDELAGHLRSQLEDKKFLLFYAYNGTGKTRLSMAFKDAGKIGDARDTLYFNAYTEDLFYWDNDLQGDSERKLRLNSESRFFSGFRELALEERIGEYLQRYADFHFRIDYDNWHVGFYREDSDYIKISRGEENIFIWCVFLAVCKMALEGNEAYAWVNYLYIDDPISSLDDNNAIAVASDLAQLLKAHKDRVQIVISSHHALFFNVMVNELRHKNQTESYSLSHSTCPDEYTLRKTTETPFFYHVAMMKELVQAAESGELFTYHFNILRSILEKTAHFFGFDDFSACIKQDPDDPDRIVYKRIVNILNHGNYSLYEPQRMVEENKGYFRKILDDFMSQYRFDPGLFAEETMEAD
jgi:wobble nucleotide-excising tRNase